MDKVRVFRLLLVYLKINVMRILLPKNPKGITVSSNQFTSEWDEKTHTLLLQFENDPEGVHIKIEW